MVVFIISHFLLKLFPLFPADHFCPSLVWLAQCFSLADERWVEPCWSGSGLCWWVGRHDFSLKFLIDVCGKRQKVGIRGPFRRRCRKWSVSSVVAACGCASVWNSCLILSFYYSHWSASLLIIFFISYPLSFSDFLFCVLPAEVQLNADVPKRVRSW